MSTLQNGPQNQQQGGQSGQSTQDVNQGTQNSYNNRQNNYQGQSSNPPRQFQPGNSSGPNGNSNNNKRSTRTSNSALESQENMIVKMYDFFNASQQQTQANAKAIANMERQIAQMAEDQRKRDSGKLPSTTEINPNHTQRAGKEHMNVVESEWRKITKEDLLGKEEESKTEEGKDKNEEDIQLEKDTQVKEDKEVPMDEQLVVAGIKKKKEKKVKKKEEPSKPIGPSINQPLWDELKNAPEDTRILQELCEKKGKNKTPTLDMIRLTVKASEALLGTLPKKERDPGSPLITVTVGDIVIRNTLLDLGASVNVLPGYLYEKYKNEELEPAKTVLQLADKSTKSLEDAPALILGRPFFATAGAVMDCKTGDLDIFFGTRKHRLNMFGCPISLPQGYDDKFWNNNPLMAPGTKGKEKIWTRAGEGGKEEILWEAKQHPLSTMDKV
ncbi:hypothetical protein L2E82_18015 [Cichorium intybus]|uniref:Uncharacterized protein n=1 Tax=Cichorium intybus TaxID=13427 RepID=A0ACB9F9V4_CICIN|nr:hypothetical protein L2E82_18015 [Cichorium intybus]